MGNIMPFGELIECQRDVIDDSKAISAIASNNANVDKVDLLSELVNDSELTRNILIESGIAIDSMVRHMRRNGSGIEDKADALAWFSLWSAPQRGVLLGVQGSVFVAKLRDPPIKKGRHFFGAGWANLDRSRFRPEEPKLESGVKTISLMRSAMANLLLRHGLDLPD